MKSKSYNRFFELFANLFIHFESNKMENGKKPKYFIHFLAYSFVYNFKIFPIDHCFYSKQNGIFHLEKFGVEKVDSNKNFHCIAVESVSFKFI